MNFEFTKGREANLIIFRNAIKEIRTKSRNKPSLHYFTDVLIGDILTRKHSDLTVRYIGENGIYAHISRQKIKETIDTYLVTLAITHQDAPFESLSVNYFYFPNAEKKEPFSIEAYKRDKKYWYPTMRGSYKPKSILTIPLLFWAKTQGLREVLSSEAIKYIGEHKTINEALVKDHHKYSRLKNNYANYNGLIYYWNAIGIKKEYSRPYLKEVEKSGQKWLSEEITAYYYGVDEQNNNKDDYERFNLAVIKYDWRGQLFETVEEARTHKIKLAEAEAKKKKEAEDKLKEDEAKRKIQEERYKKWKEEQARLKKEKELAEKKKSSDNKSDGGKVGTGTGGSSSNQDLSGLNSSELYKKGIRLKQTGEYDKQGRKVWTDGSKKYVWVYDDQGEETLELYTGDDDSNNNDKNSDVGGGSSNTDNRDDITNQGDSTVKDYSALARECMTASEFLKKYGGKFTRTGQRVNHQYMVKNDAEIVIAPDGSKWVYGSNTPTGHSRFNDEFVACRISAPVQPKVNNQKLPCCFQLDENGNLWYFKEARKYEAKRTTDGGFVAKINNQWFKIVDCLPLENKNVPCEDKIKIYEEQISRLKDDLNKNGSNDEQNRQLEEANKRINELERELENQKRRELDKKNADKEENLSETSDDISSEKSGYDDNDNDNYENDYESDCYDDPCEDY